MAISPLSAVLPAVKTTGVGGASATGATGSPGGFQTVLDQALQGVNGLVAKSENLGIALASGTAPSISSVMIAATQAQLAVDLTVQVRDRVVSAYNQVMNMQI